MWLILKSMSEALASTPLFVIVLSRPAYEQTGNDGADRRLRRADWVACFEVTNVYCNTYDDTTSGTLYHRVLLAAFAQIAQTSGLAANLMFGVSALRKLIKHEKYFCPPPRPGLSLVFVPPSPI